MNLHKSDKLPLYWVDTNQTGLDVCWRLYKDSAKVIKGSDVAVYAHNEGGLILDCSNSNDTEEWKPLGAFIWFSREEFLDLGKVNRVEIKNCLSNLLDVLSDFQDFQNKKPLGAANTQELSENVFSCVSEATITGEVI